jgi:iron(III) transport system substrate-binding protein
MEMRIQPGEVPADVRVRAGVRAIACVVATVGLLSGPALDAQEVPREAADVWPYLASLEPAERQETLEREARQEGGLVLYGATGIDRATFWIEQFNERYPDIPVEFVRLRAPELVEKVLLEHKTERTQADLVITTITYLELLSEGGVLAPYKTAHWDVFDPRFLYGDPDQWTAVVYEIFPHAIAWRTDRVDDADAPRNLEQVMDPKWKGRIGTTTHLEDTLNGLIAIYGEDSGMEKARALAALDNRLYRSHSAMADGLAAGEVDLVWGLVAARPIDLKENKGAPVGWTMTDPLLAEGNTISATTDTDKPYAAALFIDVLLDAPTLEASDAWQGGRIFGNSNGTYSLSLDDYPSLYIFPPVSPDQFGELNRIAEQLFIRGQ